MQRRIEQADRHRPAGHRPEQAGEVLPLERQQLGQRLLAVGDVFRQDHLADLVDVIEEHVLGAAQADAFGAERDRLRRLIGLVGIRADLELAVLVGPVHQLLEAAIDVRLLGCQFLLMSTCTTSLGLVATAPAKTSPVKPSMQMSSPSLKVLALDGDGALVVIDVQLAGTDDADLAHLPADEGRVRARAAERRENALGGLHAAKVFGLVSRRTRIRLTFGFACFIASAFRGVKTILPVAAPGPALMPLASSLPALLAAFFASGSKIGCSSWFRSSAGMHLRRDGFFLGDQAFFDQVDRDAHGGEAGSLGVAGLQHPDLVARDRELDVLHVLVVLLELLADCDQLLERGRACPCRASLRSAWACGCRRRRLRPGR